MKPYSNEISSILLIVTLLAFSPLSTASVFSDAIDPEGKGEAVIKLMMRVFQDEGSSNKSNNKTKAFNWFKQSADKGNADAQYSLGKLYQTGEGVPKSNKEALKWYQKSAEQGDAAAQYALGIMYDNGVGVATDKSKAFTLISDSARSGYMPAEYLLGMKYKNADGVEKDIEQAIRWFKKSADQGYIRSAVALRIISMPTNQ